MKTFGTLEYAIDKYSGSWTWKITGVRAVMMVSKLIPELWYGNGPNEVIIPDTEKNVKQIRLILERYPLEILSKSVWQRKARVKVIKKSGEREEYDRAKLEKSFNIACEKRPIPEEKIQQAISRIEEKISNISNIEIEAYQIGGLVMEELKEIDKVAFIRFASVYREFKDIGEFQAQIEDLKD